MRSYKALFRISCLGILLFLGVPASAQVNLNLSRFQIYFGDLKNDGTKDYYFRNKNLFVFISGEINVPIFLTGKSFMLKHTTATTITSSAGEQIIPYNFLTDAELLALGMVEVSASDVMVADFNGDGYDDVFVRGQTLTDRWAFLAGRNADYPVILQNSLSLPGGLNVNDRSIQIQVTDVNGDRSADLVFVTGRPAYPEIVYFGGQVGMNSLINFRYDALGRLMDVMDSETTMRTYQYDAAGNRKNLIVQ